MGTVTPERVVWSAVSVQPVTGGQVGAGGEQTLRITFGPASYLGAPAGETATLEGTGGSTVSGAWVSFGSYYLWLSHNDGVQACGPDPGDDEASLSSLTGVETALGSGNHTDVAVATAAETALGAGTPYTISRAGNQVDITGPFDATAAAVGGAWADRGSGHGCIGATDLEYTSSFGLDTMRFHQIDPSRLPVTGECRIVGVKVRRGTNVTSNLRMCVAVGGAGDGDPDGATVEAQIVVTPNGGASNWSNIYFSASQVVRVNTLTDRIFIGMMGDGAGSSIPAENIATDPNAQASHFYRNGSNVVLWVYASPSGSATAFPSTISGSPTPSSNTFVVPVQLIVQYPPYYANGEWRSYAGPTPGRNDTGVGSSNSQMVDIWVRWRYTMPAVASLRWYEVGVYLVDHSGTQELRAEQWTGSTSNLDPQGATLHHDWGETSGTDTGWNVLSEPSGVAVSASTSYSLSVKSEGSAPPGDTTLGFQAGDHPLQNTDPWGWSAAGVGSVASTEAEINDPLDGWAVYDESIVSTSPIAYTSTLPPSPNNSGGVYALIGTPGITIEANP